MLRSLPAKVTTCDSAFASRNEGGVLGVEDGIANVAVWVPKIVAGVFRIFRPVGNCRIGMGSGMHDVLGHRVLTVA